MQAHFVTKFCFEKKQLRCVAKVTKSATDRAFVFQNEKGPALSRAF
jgi:hypothetical protein